MKGQLRINKLPPPVGLKPIPLGQQATAVNGVNCLQNPKVFYWNIQYDQFATVVALSAPFQHII